MRAVAPDTFAGEGGEDGCLRADTHRMLGAGGYCRCAVPEVVAGSSRWCWCCQNGGGRREEKRGR